ncbi:MAG TPA: hypothetical protein PKM25_08350 [Candidatus Ozemobacteraceae bacterium]|nr:hypothetical protein [Candidatus Ozemobacteraceae bacterium]
MYFPKYSNLSFVLIVCLCMAIVAVSGTVVTAEAKEAGETPLASVTRMIGFEPHPSSIDVPGAFSLGGKAVSARIDLLETWNAERDVPSLEKLGFRLHLQSAGTDASIVELPVQQVDVKKLKKGGVFAAGAGEAAGLTVIINDIQKQGKRVIGLTLDFSLRSSGDRFTRADDPTIVPSEHGQIASSAISPQAVSFTGSLQIARQIAAKADAMPDAAASGRAMLYRKALSALPNEADSTQTAVFRAEITGKIDALRPAPVADPAAQTSTETVSPATFVPSLSADTSRERHDVSTEVKDLFLQAQKAFDRQDEPAARDCLRRATEKDPAFFEAWFLLGKNAVANSKYARAKESLEKALLLRGDDAEAGTLYFKACYYLGEGESGIEKLVGMTGRKPAAFAARMALADAYYQSGDLPLCEEQCLILLDTFPGNAQARGLLAKTREKMK